MAEFQRRRNKNFPAKYPENELTALTASPAGTGQLPPLDRPPGSREELARLINHLGNPAAFASWFQRLMEKVDPAEGGIRSDP
jgi:hypothetical protein